MRWWILWRLQGPDLFEVMLHFNHIWGACIIGYGLLYSTISYTARQWNHDKCRWNTAWHCFCLTISLASTFKRVLRIPCTIEAGASPKQAHILFLQEYFALSFTYTKHALAQSKQSDLVTWPHVQDTIDCMHSCSCTKIRNVSLGKLLPLRCNGAVQYNSLSNVIMVGHGNK